MNYKRIESLENSFELTILIIIGNVCVYLAYCGDVLLAFHLINWNPPATSF